jgi:predicted RND superfamily exporter protein
MSIGFSVDLSAHIAYAYAKADGDNKTRAITALETLGWPVFLGAFSTVIGIMILTLVDAYIVQLFFKTVFLVISFSLLHGIVFLPILLTVVVPDKKKENNNRI